MVVGSAGMLLTILMAKAMNRSLANALFSNFGDVVASGTSEVQGQMKAIDANDAGIAMRYAFCALHRHFPMPADRSLIPDNSLRGCRRLVPIYYNEAVGIDCWYNNRYLRCFSMSLKHPVGSPRLLN